jgi:fructuronate reductase
MTILSNQSLNALNTAVKRPTYDRSAVTPGIMHFGIGAFHRAHQAVVTDAVIANGGMEWGIAAVNLRSAKPADELESQDGLYSVVTRSGGQNDVQVVGSIVQWLCASREPDAVLNLLQSPAIKIVTMTVSEKAYGLNTATGSLDLEHPSIKADLENPHKPVGIIGYLVEGLALRKKLGLPAFTILCCDNLPKNGAVVKRLVLDMAQRRDEDLARWISESARFPSSMVDRIVPAATEDSRTRAAEVLGVDDALALETESFLQWVIEDDFSIGRPDWQIGGALFVEDVHAYEDMKLRLLNGSHTLIAHLGIMQNLECVRDVMADPANVEIVRRHMAQAAKTLAPVPGIEIPSYIEQLIARFSDKSIAHRNVQIAMDTSQKLPQRILAPAADALRNGGDAQSFAYVVALWCASISKRGTMDDPRSAEILAAVTGSDTARRIERLLNVDGLFPDGLRNNSAWRNSVEAELQLITE